MLVTPLCHMSPIQGFTIAWGDQHAALACENGPYDERLKERDCPVVAGDIFKMGWKGNNEFYSIMLQELILRWSVAHMSLMPRESKLRPMSFSSLRPFPRVIAFVVLTSLSLPRRGGGEEGKEGREEVDKGERVSLGVDVGEGELG